MQDVEEITEQNYYEIASTSDHEVLFLHKERDAPAFFRGCFDFVMEKKLGIIYKDVFNQWSLLAFLSDDIYTAFLDWACNNFDLLNGPLHSTEKDWEKSIKEMKEGGFELVVLRGELDFYCMLRYLYTCYTVTQPSWEAIFRKVEMEFQPVFV